MSDHPLMAIPHGVWSRSRPPVEWAVRPAYCLGTDGWYPYAWTVIIVEANSEQEAVRKALPIAAKQRLRIRT